MVAYAISAGSDEIFDPAVGSGAFFIAAKNICNHLKKHLKLMGTEIDPSVINQALLGGLGDEDLRLVQIRDFALDPPPGPFRAIVGNPPYIRHHRLSNQTKSALQTFCKLFTGISIDGRAGLHIYFLLRALQLLAPNGRLSFIMPADTCEGIFSHALWRWITGRYRLEAVVVFSPEASPFPSVDTNPIIFMIKNDNPHDNLLWAKCLQANTPDLLEWCISDFSRSDFVDIKIEKRELTEALKTGLSRPPQKDEHSGPVLGDFARVMRGVATGANDFFFLTAEKAQELGILNDLLIPAIGRTRDLDGEEITAETLNRLRKMGRPTLLFSPDGRPIEQFSDSVRNYLLQGQNQGLDKRALISTRIPWYKMEIRQKPHFLFCYLGRRNARFVFNRAGVIPLTAFLCVYSYRKEASNLERLWKALRHPRTVSNLSLVGKSYGSGAIKVEPRALEKLPLPEEVLLDSGLICLSRARQLSLDQI